MAGEEDFDLDHGADSTLWAALEVATGEVEVELAELAVSHGGRQQVGARDGQTAAAEMQPIDAVTVGQEAVVADALETRRHRGQQEAADELLGRDDHHLGSLRMAVILPAKGNLAIFQPHETLIGNGHAMRIAAEMLQQASALTIP